MTDMKRRLLYISLFCIYAGAILFLCLMKPDNLPEKEIFLFGLPADKLAHFTMFLPFPILSYLVFFKSDRSRLADIAILASSICLGAGAALGTEALQAMTQYRSSDIHDAYADFLGLVIGAAIVLTYILTMKNHNKTKETTEK